MAAVTVNSVKYNVNGSLRDQYYSISGATGDTLLVGLTGVKKINLSPGSLITAAVPTPTTNGMTSIAFTSSAPMVAEMVQVIGN